MWNHFFFFYIGNSISRYREINPDVRKLKPVSDIGNWFPDIGKWFPETLQCCSLCPFKCLHSQSLEFRLSERQHETGFPGRCVLVKYGASVHSQTGLNLYTLRSTTGCCGDQRLPCSPAGYLVSITYHDMKPWWLDNDMITRTHLFVYIQECLRGQFGTQMDPATAVASWSSR